MKLETDREIVSNVISMLQDCGLISDRNPALSRQLQFSWLTGDGSARKFCRIGLKGQSLCLAVFPSPEDTGKLLEARSARFIGEHLRGKGVPVPWQYAYDEAQGIILFEDLGDTRLHDLVNQARRADNTVNVEVVHSLYRQVVDNLLGMQTEAARGFDPEWCWQGGCYDRDVMLEKESGYFLRSFWQDLMNRSVPQDIMEEFEELASRCQEQPPVYFLHRDFQSRNIMVKDNRTYFIDFQGGRLGPLQYDLASLLIDPYAGLPTDFQNELLDYYCDQAAWMTGTSRKELMRGYEYLALQRNLQIIGAFSFLSQNKGKIFFRQYILPALVLMSYRLSHDCFNDFPVLRKTAASSADLLKEMQIFRK